MIYLSHKNGHFDHEQNTDQHSYKSINCTDASLYPVSKIDIEENPNRQFYFNFRGTIVPPEWKTITTKDGKKLSRGALELYAIIVSWHNYKKVKDKNTGKINLAPKFEGEEFKKNYDYFTKELDRSQEQVRRYFAELKAANLVSMELRTVWHKNWKYTHTLCIKLNKEAPHFTKGQGADYKTIKEKPSTSNTTSTSGIISNLANAELSLKDLNQSSDNTKNIKKIWASLHKKVGYTPQKSGVHIENNYFKTSLTRSDLVKSNFLKVNLTLPINFKLLANQQNSSYQVARIQTNFSKILQESDQKDDQLKPSNTFYSSDNQDAKGQENNRNNFDEALISITSASIITNLNQDQVFTANYWTDANKYNPESVHTSHSYSRNPLLSFHPLSEEDAIYLRKASGRPFNLRYINMLLLNLASKKPDHGFYTKELLLVYMTSALLGEKRDACIVNSESFNFKLKPDSLEYKTNQKKKYLNAIELSRETNILTKIKRRIIGLFNEDDAYNIITSCRLPYLTDNYNPIQYTIEAPLSITEIATQKERLTQAVQEILGQTVEVIFKEMVDMSVTTTKAGQEANSTSLIPYNNTNPEPVISSPLWQRVRETLKHLYGNTGEAMDKSWFSKLDIELSEDSKQIYIKCPSYFARDWIKANYYDVIEKAIKEIAHKAKDMFWNLATLDNVRFEYSAC